MRLAAIVVETWDGRHVNARAEVTADGQEVNVVEIGVLPGVPILMGFEIPVACRTLLVNVRPDAGHWEFSAAFSVEADGSITPSDPMVAATSRLELAGVEITRLGLRAWRVRDVSQKAADVLPKWPKLHNGERYKPDVATSPGFPPPTWELAERTLLPLDTDQPIVGNRLGLGDAVTVTPDTDELVLELAGVEAPRLLAVSWPHSLTEAAEPAPFLVYLRPRPGQEIQNGYYEARERPYPWTWDYVYLGMYQFLWYDGDPVTGAPYPKGLPYQVALSGKQVAVVVPCPSAFRDVRALMDADGMNEVLREIQAFMFLRQGVAAPESIGRTALAAFSSGTGLLSQFLTREGNSASEFFTSSLREVYVFDAPLDLTDSVSAAAMAWAAVDEDRRLRVYTQWLRPAHQRMLAADPEIDAQGQRRPVTPPPFPKQPFISSDPTGRRTVAGLPGGAFAATYQHVKGGPMPFYDWRVTHQLIASLLLTHALSVSGF